MKRPILFICFFAAAVLFTFPFAFLLAQPGKAGQESAVNIDLLIKQTEDLIREEAQILEDQKEVLSILQNLKIRVRRQ